jgi:hypothetical protein
MSREVFFSKNDVHSISSLCVISPCAALQVANHSWKGMNHVSPTRFNRCGGNGDTPAGFDVDSTRRREEPKNHSFWEGVK